MYKNKNHPKNSSRLPLIAGVIVIAVLLVGGWLLWKNSDQQNSVVTSDGINYSPPTEEEQQAANDIKDELPIEPSKDETNDGSDPDTPTTNDNDPKSVTPYISSLNFANSAVELRGYVTGIIESGGTCTIKLTRGNKTVSQSKSAVDDAQSTSCGRISVPSSKLSPGEWNVVLQYSSTKASGTSEIEKVTVE